MARSLDMYTRLLLIIIGCFLWLTFVDTKTYNLKDKILIYQSNSTDNGYYFQYKTSNGLHREETGTFIKDSSTGKKSTLKVHGQFSYISPDDNLIHITNYTAGEEGYKPEVSVKNQTTLAQPNSSTPTTNRFTSLTNYPEISVTNLTTVAPSILFTTNTTNRPTSSSNYFVTSVNILTTLAPPISSTTTTNRPTISTKYPEISVNNLTTLAPPIVSITNATIRPTSTTNYSEISVNNLTTSAPPSLSTTTTSRPTILTNYPEISINNLTTLVPSISSIYTTSGSTKYPEISANYNQTTPTTSITSTTTTHRPTYPHFPPFRPVNAGHRPSGSGISAAALATLSGGGLG